MENAAVAFVISSMGSIGHARLGDVSSLLRTVVGRKVADPETAEYSGFKGLWALSGFHPTDNDE